MASDRAKRWLWREAVCAAAALLLLFDMAAAFDMERNDNLAVYWGQDASGHQQRLSYYCQDDVYDTIPLAFLYAFFGTGGEPMMSFANICNEGNGTFPGTELSNCTFMASDIQQCQSKGKTVTLSLGGADSAVGFTNRSQAEDFADSIWDMFLGGSSDIRPFGDAVLDGVDLDIEGGLPTNYNFFVDRLRTHTDKASKKYIITAAPQCPFPDANIGPAINESRFDAIYVQFYNNYCGLNYPAQFDFALWDTWAKTQSPNPDVKIYIGAPGSATAAGQGYVDPSVLQKYALTAQKDYTTFGGVMLWDASDAYENNRYDKAIKEALAADGQDVPSGGSGGSGSGSGGAGGSGSGTNSTNSSPGGGTGTNDGGVDGGDTPGQDCFQSKLAVADQQLFTRRSSDGIYVESQRAVRVITTIAHRQFSQLSARFRGQRYRNYKFSLARRSEL